MAFDATSHLIRMMLIRFAQKMNPNERNVSMLYQSALEKLGLLPIEVANFDPVPHLVRLLVLSIGRELNPNEKDLMKLHDETALDLGVLPVQVLGVAPQNEVITNAARAAGEKAANQLPSPGEMLPPQECPKCKEKSLRMDPICPDCADSDGGKYKTMYQCTRRECGYKEKSAKPFVVALQETGFKFEGMISKRALGVRTITDPDKAEGVRG